MSLGGWGFCESIVKNIFSDDVKPVVGSVLKCDLALNMVSHTGIYLGNDRIAEVTEINGRARVRAVSPDEFLNGDSDSMVRTGAFIYVAACDGEALGSAEIARRARACLNRSRGEYGVTDNNCHKFTAYCITGSEPDDVIWSEDEIAELVAEAFGVDSVEWCSTGLGCGDSSFDDVDYDSDGEENDEEEEDDDDEEDYEDDDDEEEEDDDWDVESDDDDEYIEVAGSLSDILKHTSARRSRKVSIQQLLGGKKTVSKKPSKRAPAKKRPVLKVVPAKRAAHKAKRRVVSKVLRAKKATPLKKAVPAKRAAPKAKRRRR